MSEKRAKKLKKVEILVKEIEKTKQEQLDVSGMQLGGAEWLMKANVISLVSLNLSFNDITTFPIQISALVNLEELNISGNLLQTVPQNFFSPTTLPNLREFYLNGNQLKEIPHTLGYLTNLEKLYMQNNQLRNIVEEIGCLRKLEELNISGNPIGQLHPAIGECIAMEVMDASFCVLTALPNEFTFMTRMMELNLGTNELKGLPSEFGRMTRLCRLNLGDNKLSDLPLSLGYCIGLCKLGAGIRLDRNPLSDQNMIRKYQIGTDHLFDFLEKRMMVTGEPKLSPVPKVNPRKVRTDPSIPGPSCYIYPSPAPSKQSVTPPTKQLSTPPSNQRPTSPSPASLSVTPTAVRPTSPGPVSQVQRKSEGSIGSTVEDKMAALKNWGKKAVEETRAKLSFLAKKVDAITQIEEVAVFAQAIKKLNPILDKVDELSPRQKVNTPLQATTQEEKMTIYKRAVARAFTDVEYGLQTMDQFFTSSVNITDIAKMAKILKELAEVINENWPNIPIPGNSPSSAPSRHSAPPASISPVTEAPITQTKTYQPPPLKVAEVSQQKKEPTPSIKIVEQKTVANDEVECEYCGKIGKPDVILKHMDICPASPGSNRVSTIEDDDSNLWLVLPKWAKVTADYVPASGLELRLRVNDIITVLGRVDEQWLKGELYGTVGVFKISCCAPSDQPPPQLSNNVPITTDKSKSKDKKAEKVSIDEEVMRLKKQGIERQYEDANKKKEKTVASPKDAQKKDKAEKGKKRVAVAAKKFMVADRNDDKTWVKITLNVVSLVALYEAVAKRLRVEPSKIAEIHTATVLDELTGKADINFVKVLKADADVIKQPNGTFLEVILHGDFNLKEFTEKFFAYDKRTLKELIGICEERGLDTKNCTTKTDFLEMLRRDDLLKTSFKQAIDFAKHLGVDASKCDSKADIGTLLANIKPPKM